MALEYRYSQDPGRYPALARELIARKCDVIFAFVAESIARALLDARADTPIVFLAFDYDPVESGIVSSYARPGGSITGVYTPVAALTMKRLEIAVRILKGTKPGDIPHEQAAEFLLVVNLKTVQTLGIKVPQAVLARATRVIE